MSADHTALGAGLRGELIQRHGGNYHEVRHDR